MAGVFHLSEMLSLALHSMVYIATSDDQYVNVKQIAASTDASEAHLSKVLQRLVKGRLIHSVRGPRGGFALAMAPEEISFLNIYEVIEGPIVIEGCPNHRKTCPFSSCIFKGIPEKMNNQFFNYLEKNKLSDFLGSRKKTNNSQSVV